MIHKTYVSLAFLLALLLSVPTSAAQHTKDSLAKVKKNVTKKKALIVDVREKSEWDQGHLEGAILVPLSKLRSRSDDKEFLKRLAKLLPKDKIVYCHCRAGRRALAAGDILGKLKYDVRPLKSGYAQLLRAGFKKAKDGK